MKLLKLMAAALVGVLIFTAGNGIRQAGCATLYYRHPAASVSAPVVNKISEIPVPAVPAGVTDARGNGVVTAAEWKAYYPDIVASWERNAENTERTAYTEDDPYIKVLYQGIGFAFDYTSAVGHNYTIEDVGKTERPHKLANCITCKTPDYTALVNKEGVSAYSLTFDEVYPGMAESVSCYNCHANTPGTIVLTHDYAAAAWNDEVAAGTVSAADASCGQCHIEYYFDKDTKATSVPYSDKAGIHPDAILAYYNEMGFVDFTNANTGVGMIKVQHPEFETVIGEGNVHGDTFSCADCHMGVAYNEKGEAYANHTYTNPQDNAQLMKASCSVCHNDLAGMVKSIQSEITAREAEVGSLLAELNAKLAEAVANGTKTEEELAVLRSLDRDAQFYWDFVYVENSEGAHNSKLSRECLSKAEALANEALVLLK